MAAGRIDRVVIRALPKAVFLYPTLLAAIVAGSGMSLELASADVWGTAFVVVFALNVVVLAFEFPRTTSLTLFFLGIATVLGAVLINQRIVFLPELESWVGRIAPEANSQFYWLIVATLGLVLLLTAILHRWVDYWEIYSNELIHHHGLLGNLERYPAPGIKLEKEITDVFEFFILGAGRLVLTVPSEGRAIVLENVPGINRVERQMKEVLGVTEVEINPT